MMTCVEIAELTLCVVAAAGERCCWFPDKSPGSTSSCLLGHEVKLSAGGRVHTGRAVGIGDKGGLVIMGDCDGKQHTFYAGDVHLLPVEDRNPAGQEGESDES